MLIKHLFSKYIRIKLSSLYYKNIFILKNKFGKLETNTPKKTHIIEMYPSKTLFCMKNNINKFETRIY